jgi:hypothetical protein
LPTVDSPIARSRRIGTLAASPEGSGAACTARFDERGIEGVDPDLVVRMFGWKRDPCHDPRFLAGRRS